MKSKQIWSIVNWSILVVVFFLAAWMIWGFPGGNEEVIDDDVFTEVTRCLDLEKIEDIEYESCYDKPSETVFLKVTRGGNNYEINDATVSFVGLVSHSYDLGSFPTAGDSGAYKFFSGSNPGNIKIKPDVVKTSSEWFCSSGGVFVDYCPTGTSGEEGNVTIDSVGGVDVVDFIDLTGDIDISDSDSDSIALDLVDREKIWESRCSSSWECGEWQSCEGGVQRRDCEDLSNCLVPTNSPARTQNCDGSCIEDWSCDWSSCSNGVSTPTCNDDNKCGTSYSMPEPISCRESKECSPDISCTAWSECRVDYDFLDLVGSDIESEINGAKTRVCIDQNACIPAKKEERECSVSVDIYTKKFERCGEKYVGIYSILDDDALAIFRDDLNTGAPLNIYFGDEEGVYCDYCFDGIMNGDEEGLDCGGSCEKCESEVYFEVERNWWDFLF